MKSHTPYCPLPGAYAVAQLNVKATLNGLGDPTALEAAQKLGTAKCLVYLCTCLQIPFPHDRWCSYMIYLVGPGPRPDDPGRFSTSEMCIPISPCSRHPTNRQPIHPYGPFPFSNCYQWSGLGMERRVRVATRACTEYNEGKVAWLSGIEHVKMEEVFSADYIKSAKDMRAAEAAGILYLSHLPDGDQRHKTSTDTTVITDDPTQATDAAQMDGHTDGHCNEDASDTALQHAPADDFDNIKGLEIYGLTCKAEEYLLPVIDVCLDLGAQFPQDLDVPSPLDFIREYDALVRIVRAAKGPSRARNSVASQNIL